MLTHIDKVKVGVARMLKRWLQVVCHVLLCTEDSDLGLSPVPDEILHI
jgi:hypothetical protein